MNRKVLKYIISIIFLSSVFFVISTNYKSIDPINTSISEIRVITDDDYAPYSFRDENGDLKGLLIDEWNLWSIKTGIKVVLDGDNWKDAVIKTENGEYDVIETFYKTEDRINSYNFSEPYSKSNLQIFFHKDLLGVTDIKSLKGFTIGVRKGDAYINLLEENGIHDYIEFDRYEQIIKSFKANKIDVFIMDKSPALHHLHKHNVLYDFKFTEVNYKNSLHRGVKKKNSEILRVVNIGFSRISDSEYKQLEEKWFGSIYSNTKLSSNIKIFLIAVLPLLLILFLLNIIQKRIIKEKIIEIKKSEDKINAIVKSIPDLFFVINKDGLFVDYHANETDGFLFKPEDFLNKSIYDLFDFNHILIKDLKKAIQETLITGEIEILEYDIPLIKDFNCYEARIIRYNDDHILAVIRDISNEKAVAMKIYDMSVKDDFTGLYNRNYFEKKLDEIDCEEFSDYGLVACDLDGLKLINDTLGHHVGDKYLTISTQIIRESFGREGSIISRTGGDEFVILLKHTSEDELLEMTSKAKDLMKYTTEYKNLIIPISISMGYTIYDVKSNNIRELLKEADDFMYRNKLHNKQSSKSDIINTLKQVLETRDYDTEDHCQRLEALSIELAKSVHLKDKDLQDMVLFAKFHDFGKIGISDQILLKTYKLTDDEFDEMKRHSEIGSRIAQSSPDISHISNWILHHHEWWDGSGYPLGLAGENIPLQCRILSIVDAYDAMTNDRPYRRAMSKKKAIDELKRYSGRQFDPEIVDHFIKIISKLN